MTICYLHCKQSFNVKSLLSIPHISKSQKYFAEVENENIQANYQQNFLYQEISTCFIEVITKNVEPTCRQQDMDNAIEDYKTGMSVENCMILYYHNYGSPNKKLCIPSSMVPEILFAHHDHIIGGGHPGIDRTYSRIKSKFHIPRI